MKNQNMLFVVFDNQDYMGGSFMSAGFYKDMEEVKTYIKSMNCWSGNISVTAKVTLDKLNYRFCHRFEFTPEERRAIINKYRELTGDTSEFKWLKPY